MSHWEGESRSAFPAEQLFVETALKFVKPNGYLAIVLPDGILNNPGLKFIRTWLLRRSRLIASVDLPKTTFKASGGVNNPSVLIVQKFTRQQAAQADKGVIDTAYQVFMATRRRQGLPLVQSQSISAIQTEENMWTMMEIKLSTTKLPLSLPRSRRGWSQVYNSLI